MVSTDPQGRRNGIEQAPHDYAYRGAKTLEAELPFECAAGCGRRLETDRWPECAVCRESKQLGSRHGQGGSRYQGGRPAPVRCDQCGFKRGSKNCRKTCGSPR